GFTMVELIVSFAILAIFLIAVSMAITVSVRQYNEERNLIMAFDVADTITSMLKDDIRSMQGTVNGMSDTDTSDPGYIKLRDADGNTVPFTDGSPAAISGETIEFVMPGASDNDCAEQIDAKGFVGSDGAKGVLVKNHSVINDKVSGLDEGYLTFRYYRKDIQENNDSYKTCYVDACLADTSFADEVGLSSGKKVARDAEERISAALYHNYKIELTFSVTPEEYTPTSATDDYIVKYVDITVNVIHKVDGSLAYSKKSSVALLNKVLYKSSESMYSDFLN
nr:type II secretion system GspH family protein [Lachnospiraceae bacterium]